MSIFKGHTISVNQLLNFIPESLLIHLSETSKVDYYTKVLHGKKMFYLLMYGILENDRLSQRTIEDTFNDPVFKLLFQLDESERVRRSSISERLSKIDADFFRQIYECIYSRFSDLYSGSESQKYNLIRVDSSMVCEASTKLVEGIDNKSGKRAAKYSIGFDVVLPCEAKVFTSPMYASEDYALPEVVSSHLKQESGHQNIYVFDRGLQPTRNISDFTKQSTTFIARAKENRKYIELESFINESATLDLGDIILVKDLKANLYTGVPRVSKKGKKWYKELLVEESFRLIIASSKGEAEKQFWFLTNNFELPAKEITDAYKRRWDIEVFFRFIKQELNASHLLSLNKNGIEVMLYMTLIVAMLLLIYKRINNIGYKTAKRRFTMEVRNLDIDLIVIKCGGGPIYFSKQKRSDRNSSDQSWI
jgi:hypothetical protein